MLDRINKVTVLEPLTVHRTRMVERLSQEKIDAKVLKGPVIRPVRAYIETYDSTGHMVGSPALVNYYA